MQMASPVAQKHPDNSKAHLQEVSCLLGKFGANILKVFLVELAVQVASHFLLVESPVFAERAHKLDPIKGGERRAKALRISRNSAATSPNPAASLNRPQVQPQQGDRLGSRKGHSAVPAALGTGKSSSFLEAGGGSLGAAAAATD